MSEGTTPRDLRESKYNQKMNAAKITTLEAALEIVKNMDEIASATIWTPDAEEMAEHAADGITLRPRLEVTVWKSHRNPTDVRCSIEGLGLVLVGDGSAIDGKCYSFELA